MELEIGREVIFHDYLKIALEVIKEEKASLPTILHHIKYVTHRFNKNFRRAGACSLLYSKTIVLWGKVPEEIMEGIIEHEVLHLVLASIGEKKEVPHNTMGYASLAQDENFLENLWKFFNRLEHRFTWFLYEWNIKSMAREAFKKMELYRIERR